MRCKELSSKHDVVYYSTRSNLAVMKRLENLHCNDNSTAKISTRLQQNVNYQRLGMIDRELVIATLTVGKSSFNFFD